MWQVSGAHGPIDRRDAISSMFDYVDSGFTTWDLADHYGPAEDLIGEFRRQLSHRSGRLAAAQLTAKEAAESDTGHHKQRRFASLVVCEI